MDDTLRSLAEHHDGIFTTAQARLIGISDEHLAGLRARKEVRSLARSVYALPTVVPEDPLALHELRTRAALLVYPDAWPCSASALALSGVATWGTNLGLADIVRPVRREVLTALCRIRPPHPRLRPADSDEGRIAGAVVQTALDHGHLAGIVSADSASHEGRTTEEEIRSVASAVKGWARAGRVRTMLAFMDGRAESIGESRLRVLVTVGGLRLVPQFGILDNGRIVARVDFLVDGTNLCLEFDGRVKYAQDPESLWREKREDRIRRLGFRVERVIWSQLERPRALLARIRHEVSLSEARPPILEPEDTPVRRWATVGEGSSAQG